MRYGLQLETVREQMAAGTWLCPHCYEEDHPEEVTSRLFSAKQLLCDACLQRLRLGDLSQINPVWSC